MKIGIALGRLGPAAHLEVACAADRLGFESVWLPEHLVFPVRMQGSPFGANEHPPVPPSTPVFDAFAYLAHIAALTRRIRLGTHVYLPPLRHPFVFARAVQTLDVLSKGRAEIGVGAGWLASEFEAAGIDFATRGRRLDETILVAERLWTEECVEHHGEFYDFEPVMFEPKPVQKPHPRVHVGGESAGALRRAARLGGGWIGLEHTPASVSAPLSRLRTLLDEQGRETSDFETSVMTDLQEPEQLAAFATLGVTRLIVAPWTRSSSAAAELEAFAERFSQALDETTSG